MNRTHVGLLLSVTGVLAACASAADLSRSTASGVSAGSVSSTCSDVYVPPGFTAPPAYPAVGYQTVEVVSGPANEYVFQLVDGAPIRLNGGYVSLEQLTPNLGYPATTTPGAYVIGTENSQWVVTSGPQIGATVELQACAGADYTNCGTPWAVSVASCAPPPPPPPPPLLPEPSEGGIGDGGDAGLTFCVPSTCAELFANCGLVSAGCGVSRECGSCAADKVCSNNGCCAPGTTWQYDVSENEWLCEKPVVRPPPGGGTIE